MIVGEEFLLTEFKMVSLKFIIFFQIITSVMECREV